MRALPFCYALALASLLSAGIKPRADSSEYRNHETLKEVTIAAEIVSASQVRSTFTTDLTRDYVVIEVGLYPAAGGSLKVSTDDFLLRCGTQIIRRGTPNAIAERRRHQNASKRSDVDIYPSVGIGYESGNDPYNGRRHGVYTTGGVVVATGGSAGPRPASTDQDQRTMALELEEKQLPDRVTSQPLAGYLYFPFASNKQKRVAYELEYDGPAGRTRMILK